MTPANILLLACGSFNPPTNMHFRMFEIAKDHLQQHNFEVVGGVLSPVHDSYGKEDLVAACHRLEMLKLGVSDQTWLDVSTWECNQENWTPTLSVLEHHQNAVDLSSFNNSKTQSKLKPSEIASWVPDRIVMCEENTHVKLLCGADLLESFATPGLWNQQDIEKIVAKFGLVVVTREGSNPNKFIYESDLLSNYQSNITVITDWITNEVSSTKIRRALRRSQSVKYLVPDDIISYITKNQLYNPEIRSC